MPGKTAFNYFEAFSKLSELAVQESDALIEAVSHLDSYSDPKNLIEQIHQLENRGDEINHAIFENASLEFITPIDREDIIALASALDTVLDTIEDVVLRFYMYDIDDIPESATSFSLTIKNIAVDLDQLIVKLRDFKKQPKDMKELLIKVNDGEEAGDRLYLNSVRNLFTERKDNPIYIIKWLEIYKHMERCCDACEHAADVVSTVLLKNS